MAGLLRRAKTRHCLHGGARIHTFLAKRKRNGPPDSGRSLSAEGDWLASWPDFYQPMDLFQDVAGRLYVTDKVPLTIL